MRIKFHPGRLLARLWRDFTVPALLCAIIFILGSIQPFLDLPFTTPTYATFSSVIGACVIGMVLATAVCTLIRKPLISRLASLVAAGIGLTAYLLTEDDNLAAGLILASIALSFWGACGKNQPALRLNQIIGWFFTCLGLSLVMCFALMLILSAVTGLLFDGLAYRITNGISSGIAYFCFLLFAPWLFLGGLPGEDTPADKRVAFLKFNSRVLLPLSLALMAVLLVYVGKIVVTWTMPVGTMNGYALAAMSLFTFFHLTLTGEENRLSRLFRDWGAWLMLPVLIAQQIGVWMRLDAYGLTQPRVLGMVCTLLCAGVVVTALMRKRARWFFPAAAVLALIFIASPVHAGNIAIWNQVDRLESALERNGMLAEDGRIVANPYADEADQAIIWSSLDYVLGHADDTQPIAAQIRKQLYDIGDREYVAGVLGFFSNSEMQQLVGFSKPGSKTSNRYWTFNGTASQTALSVSGYDYAKWIYVSDYRYSNDDEDKAAARDTAQHLKASHYTFPVMDVFNTLSAWDASDAAFPDASLPVVIDGEAVDLREMLTSLEETTEPNSPYDRNFTVIQDKLTLPSGRVFHLEELNFSRYDYTSHSSYYVRFSGWLLTPEVE